MMSNYSQLMPLEFPADGTKEDYDRFYWRLKALIQTEATKQSPLWRVAGCGRGIGGYEFLLVHADGYKYPVHTNCHSVAFFESEKLSEFVGKVINSAELARTQGDNLQLKAGE